MSCTVAWQGRGFRSANGVRGQITGERTVTGRVHTAGGQQASVSTKYQVGGVVRPVMSVSKAVNSGKAVWFAPGSSGVIDAEHFHLNLSSDYLPFEQRKGVYEVGVQPVERMKAERPIDMLAPVELVDGVDEQQEKTTNKLLPAPVDPTAKEREEHTAHHLVFKSWRGTCFDAKLKED